MSAPHADPALEERARRIVETSIELAERGGFEAVRLRDVAAHAGVALGTLYRRFRSKEDLLVAALEQETRALAQRIRQRPPKGAEPSERVVGFFEIATRGMLRRPNLSRAMLRATAAGEPVLAQKVEIFHDLMRGMIVSALRGEPVAGDSAWIADEERLVGDLLNRVWFALMMSWAGGVQSQGTIALQMRASVELVLARSVSMAIPQAGAMGRVGIQGRKST
jgi:TetR/AcrR family transcriptional regulator, cholesterol catabolism regulator